LQIPFNRHHPEDNDMKENMHARLPGSVLTELKQIAEAHGTTISKLIAEEMKEIVKNGVQPERKEPIKATSLYLDRAIADSFRKCVADAHVPFDRAMRQVAENVLRRFHGADNSPSAKPHHQP